MVFLYLVVMETIFINTPLGTAKIKGDENGVALISILQEGEISKNIPLELKQVVKQLDNYFKGTSTHFTVLLNPKGTDFQKRVWNELLQIPYGKTISYLELAKKLGDEKAVRAVAAANGKNPLWIVVPCHRVLGSDGSLTGYAGGLWRKKWLLDHENPVKQQSLF